ncbi:helix-turn-helix domain-containing protein [Altererythrobacter xixiisoli]|uniref:Helix-turn-helix domain-containing protein n=1 Tax=Croceibacterium xixiisoli TaxID=1476466 RepID=A0A6I4TSD2_9SPHN|nr:AraC family transcriptional regulator [Croceibacterium xixiisoli]MXO98229.1 helix-turn-helix domain-containing protein [Croceibacterium xixiisoli]
MGTPWQEFSTDTVVASLRARRWSEYGSETLSEMHVDPLAGDGFRASMRRCNLGPLGFVVIDSSPARASSRAVEAGPWATNGSDYLMMTVADYGKSTLAQSGWSADLNAGDIVIRDLAKPWESMTSNNMGLVLIKIPFSLAAKYHADPERLVGRHLPASDPRVAFASTVIRASKDALQAVPDAAWTDHLSDVLAGVFRLICHDDFGEDVVAHSSTANSLRRSATALIARHLHDPDLTVCAVADTLGVTPRHLQRAFLDAGISPRQFILEERLAEAARLLSVSRDDTRILDIAFSVGFNDASHFTKSFNQKFGCSPRVYRSRRSS